MLQSRHFDVAVLVELYSKPRVQVGSCKWNLLLRVRLQHMSSHAAATCLAQDITDYCTRMLAAGPIASGSRDDLPSPAPLVAPTVGQGGDGSDDATLTPLMRTACAVVQEMRSAIVRVTGGLTCSAGIACNAMLAKVRGVGGLLADVAVAHVACNDADCIKLQQAQRSVLPVL